MDHTGHTTISFDRDNATEVARAMATFNKLLNEGYVPAERAERGGGAIVKLKSERVFNPEAEETIMIPHFIGG